MSDRTVDAAVDDEPSVLGAAATEPFQRLTRAERAERRRTGSAPEPELPAAPTGSRSDTTSGSGIVRVYEPYRRSVPALRPYVRALWERRAFMVELAKADLRGQRADSTLGSLWGILDPLFQSAIYYFLFTVIRGGGSAGGRPIDFLPVLIVGILLFQQVMAAMQEGGKSITRSANLMLNSTFPRALLPLAAVYKGFLKFLPGVVVIGVVLVVLDAPVGWDYLLLPVLFLLQQIMSVGLALFFSALIVFFRDLGNALRYITRVLFFTTPVIWPLALLSESMRSILQWQPLYGLFASYQTVIGPGTPTATMLALAVGWSFAVLLLGGWVFLRYENDFARHL